MNFRRAAQDDLSAILGLLEANLADNLSVEKRKSGFLSAKFTRAHLAEMANDLGIIVADDGRRIVGFLCASQLAFNRQFPLLAAMRQQFDRLPYGGKPLSSCHSFMYGPVCVDRSQRGKGLLREAAHRSYRQVRGRRCLRGQGKSPLFAGACGWPRHGRRR
jgi:hypothetical protein